MIFSHNAFTFHRLTFLETSAVCSLSVFLKCYDFYHGYFKDAELSKTFQTFYYLFLRKVNYLSEKIF